MKRVLCLLILLVTNLLISARYLPAEESGLSDYGVKDQKLYNRECLLVAINCGNDFISLDQKIDMLRREIAKGRAVYTEDELRILRDQLNNAKKTLEYFRNEGAGNWYKFPGE